LNVADPLILWMPWQVDPQGREQPLY
jgi:hypothetical protein